MPRVAPGEPMPKTTDKMLAAFDAKGVMVSITLRYTRPGLSAPTYLVRPACWGCRIACKRQTCLASYFLGASRPVTRARKKINASLQPGSYWLPKLMRPLPSCMLEAQSRS